MVMQISIIRYQFVAWMIDDETPVLFLASSDSMPTSRTCVCTHNIKHMKTSVETEVQLNSRITFNTVRNNVVKYKLWSYANCKKHWL